MLGEMVSDSYAGNYIRKAAQKINEDYITSRETSLAMTKLEEAMMWLDKAKTKTENET